MMPPEARMDAPCRQIFTDTHGNLLAGLIFVNPPGGPEALAPLFPMELIKQEVATDKWIDIPDGVRDVYTLWRPSPLYRAYNFEKALDTPARIYYKFFHARLGAAPRAASHPIYRGRNPPPSPPWDRE
jgi:hypothetical protein